MSEDLDPDVAAAFAGVKPQGAAASVDDIDPDVAAAFRGVSRGARPETARPTRQSVRQPTKTAPPKEEAELSWGETGTGAVRNLVPSTVGAVKSLASAVMHPVETAKGLGKLGVGVGSQLAGAAGMQQDPAQKAQNEAVISALEDQYKANYGSVRGFKKAVAKDPASVLLDASTLLDGVGAVAKGSTLGSVAAKAARLTDPIQGALAVAKAPVKMVGKAIPHVQAFQTGKSVAALKKAAEAGANADPKMREAFQTYLTGKGDPADITATAERALSEISRERGQKYVADMAALKGGVLPPIPWKPVEDALKDNVEQTRFNASGSSRVVNREASRALEEIADEVDWYKGQPADSTAHTLEGFDALKRRIGDIRNSFKNDPVAFQKATSMYNAVLDTIKQHEPKYAEIMERYGRMSDQLRQIGASFSLGKRGRASKETILGKLKRAGHKEFGDDFIGELAQREPALPYMIAGHELHQWMPGGIRGAIGAAGAYAVHPMASVAGIAAMSPRLSANANFAAGQAGRSLAKLTKPGTTKALYYAGETPKLGAPEIPAVSENEDGEKAGLTDFDLKKMLGLKGDAPAVEATPEDIDAATRMVIGEAGGEDDEGKAAAIHTALNRVKQSGETLGEVVARPYAFEAVTSGRTKAIDPESPEYKYVRDHIVLPALAGDLADPTEGAVHFINKDLQHDEGRPIPKWASGEGKQIGRHTFFPGEYRAGRARGGKVNGVDIEPMVLRLMGKAKAAKAHETKVTKPLLGASDDAVAHALKVAQEAI